MQRIGDVFNEYQAHTGVGAKLRDAAVLSLWDEVVGPTIAQHAAPKAVSRGTLYVRVKSPAWAQELQAMVTTITKRLNEAAGGQIVRDIRFINEPVPAKEIARAGGGKAPDIGGISLSGDEDATLAAMARAVADEELRAALLTAATRAKKLTKWRSAHGGTVCAACRTVYIDAGKGCPYCG